MPFWRKDSKEIIIANPKGEVWSVRVEAAGGALRFSAPELFSGLRWPVGYNVSTRPLAVSRDGSRIYLLQPVEQPESGVIHVRMAW
jgi:hypothetical protein